MNVILHEILSSGVILESARGGIRATGPLTDRVRGLIRAHKPALLEELTQTPHYRWRVSRSDGVHEACFLPEATLTDAAAAFPDATLAPLLETVAEVRL